jgi:hypothetical protein
MGNSVKRDLKTIATQEKRARALELRKQGYNYRQIAKVLGSSSGYVHDLVQTAIRDLPRELAEDVRTIELSRLDRYQAALDREASKGDPKAILAAVKLMDRRAKYLGLDAPSQVEVTGADGSPIGLAPVIMIPPERSNGIEHANGVSESATAEQEGLDPEPGTPN